MRSKDLKPRQVVSQSLSQGDAQLPDVAPSCPVNPRTNNQVPRQQIKCVSPKTFSQKLYQSNPLEIAEELERAVEANSLEELKNVLEKFLELGV